jgi:hypothetical protein
MNRRAAIRAGAHAVLAAALVLGPVATAEGLGDGGGPLTVRAAAMGVGSQFVFSRPGSAPVEPPIDGRFGAAGGSLDQLAGNAFGFASSFYPGDTPATPGSVIPLLGFPIGGQIFPADHPIRKEYDAMAGFIPPWPMATHGSYPGDPGRRVDLLADVTGNIPAPLPTEIQGMTQETTVDELLVVAETNIDRLTVSGMTGLNPEFEPLTAQFEQMTKPFRGDRPGVRGSSFTLRGLNSLYRMVNEGPRARSTSEVTVGEVSVLGGLFEFFRVRAHATHEATAAGVKLLGYGTEVGLARILGLEVTFDDKGAVLTDRRVPPDQRDAFQAALDQFLRLSPFRVKATAATVKGTRVTGSAFTFSFDGQEPTLPGISPIGRRTRITWTVGSIDADMEVFSPPASPPFAETDGPSGGPGKTAVSLPGTALLSDGGRERASAPSKPPTPRPASASGLGTPRRARTGSPSPILGGDVDRIAEALAPVVTGEGHTAGTPVLAAAPVAASAGAVRTMRGAEKPSESTRMILHPGVTASEAEQQEIAAAVQDVGRRMVVFAGLGVLGGLVVWRRREGRLQ